MAKISEQVKVEFMEMVRRFLEDNGEDVLQTKSGTYAVPWVRNDEEGYLTITFSIPRGSREDKEPYDGYSEAETYRLNQQAKEEKKKENEKKKAEKIARDAAAREKKKKEKEKKEGE